MLQQGVEKEGEEMTRESIEKALVRGYFGEHNGEIDFLLSQIYELEENHKHALELAETYKGGWEGCEEKVRELESEVSYMESLGRAKIEADQGWAKAENNLTCLLEAVKMPTAGDKSGIPATAEVKNKDVLMEWTDKSEFQSFICEFDELMWDLRHDKIRSITIIKKGGINR